MTVKELSKLYGLNMGIPVELERDSNGSRRQEHRG
jgi:hypothetical protein